MLYSCDFPIRYSDFPFFQVRKEKITPDLLKKTVFALTVHKYRTESLCCH